MKVTNENFFDLLMQSLEEAAAYEEGTDTRERVIHCYPDRPRQFRPAAFRHTGEARRVYHPRLKIETRRAIKA